MGNPNLPPPDPAYIDRPPTPSLSVAPLNIRKGTSAPSTPIQPDKEPHWVRGQRGKVYELDFQHNKTLFHLFNLDTKDLEVCPNCDTVIKAHRNILYATKAWLL